jgi:cation transport ATPase
MKRFDGKWWGWQGMEWWEGMRSAINFYSHNERIGDDLVVTDRDLTTTDEEDVEAIDRCDSDLDRELVIAPDDRAATIVERHLNFKLVLGAIVSGLLIYGSLPRILGKEIVAVPQWWQLPIWQLLLTTILVGTCAGSIWKRNIYVRDRDRWQWQVNDAIAPNTIAAYVLAILGTIFPELFDRTYLYYPVVAIIITLNLFGRKLHQRADDLAAIASPELYHSPTRSCQNYRERSRDFRADRAG